jgi:alpha-tubulin suppressor-like RCC1 family protein
MQVEKIEDDCIEVSCGFRHTLFLTENGKVFAVGSNKKHELGLGNQS